MEVSILILDAILLIFPAIFIIFRTEDIKMNESLYKGIKYYLVIITGFFISHVVMGVYFKIIFSTGTVYLIMLLILTSVFLLFKIEFEDFERRFYLLFIILYLVALFFITYSIFFPTQEYELTFDNNDSFSVLFVLILATAIPLGILFITHRKLLKRAVRYEISTDELKKITLYFAIAIIIFLILGIVSFSITYDLTTFSGEGFFDNDVADKTNAVFNSILNDPLFIFTAILTMLGALATVLGRAEYTLIGNFIMAFLPMFLWLNIWFGDTPEPIVDLFVGFEFFAKVFHVVIGTMMIVIILSAWRLFTGVVAFK